MKIEISRATAKGNKRKNQNETILSSTLDEHAWYSNNDDEYHSNSTLPDTSYIREHHQARIKVKSKRVSYSIEKGHFQNTININQNNAISSNNISRNDAILSKNNEIGYNTYGWQVEELALWRYALLIKGNKSSAESAHDKSIEMVLPYQLLPYPQQGMPHLFARKVKFKVNKDSVNTWVGAFSETQFWIDALWILMGQEMMTSVPLLTNIRNFQEYPLDWPKYNHHHNY